MRKRLHADGGLARQSVRERAGEHIYKGNEEEFQARGTSWLRFFFFFYVTPHTVAITSWWPHSRPPESKKKMNTGTEEVLVFSRAPMRLGKSRPGLWAGAVFTVAITRSPVIRKLCMLAALLGGASKKARTLPSPFRDSMRWRSAFPSSAQEVVALHSEKHTHILARP